MKHAIGNSRLRALDTYMATMLDFIASCERTGRLARPAANATREALETLGLIEQRPAPVGAVRPRPHWVRTEAGRNWR